MSCAKHAYEHDLPCPVPECQAGVAEKWYSFPEEVEPQLAESWAGPIPYRIRAFERKSVPLPYKVWDRYEPTGWRTVIRERWFWYEDGAQVGPLSAEVPE